MNIAERTKSEYSPLEIDVQIGIRDVHRASRAHVIRAVHNKQWMPGNFVDATDEWMEHRIHNCLESD